MPQGRPSFEVVFMVTFKVSARVPAGARAFWAEYLIHAAKHVAFYNDPKAWLQLMAVP